MLTISGVKMEADDFGVRLTPNADIFKGDFARIIRSRFRRHPSHTDADWKEIEDNMMSLRDELVECLRGGK